MFLGASTCTFAPSLVLLTAYFFKSNLKYVYRSLQLSQTAKQKTSLGQCKLCSYRGLRCSVLETGCRYPCFYCTELGYTCEGEAQATIKLRRYEQPEQLTAPNVNVHGKFERRVKKASLSVSSRESSIVQKSNGHAITKCRQKCETPTEQDAYLSDELTKNEASRSVASRRLTERACDWCRDWKHGLFSFRDDVNEHKSHLRHERNSGKAKSEFKNSFLCSKGKMARIKMLQCECHSMKPIFCTDPNLLDLDVFYMKLMSSINADCTSAVENRLNWCMMCPSPALYRCCASSKKGLRKIARKDEEPSKSLGCGLHLCQICTFDLMDRCKNEIQKMLGSALEDVNAGNTSEERPWGWRPDIVLLQRFYENGTAFDRNIGTM